MPTRFHVLCTLLITLVGVSLSAEAQQADFNKPFPPHKVIGNVYYVGVDVSLGAHGSFYGVTEKHARIGKPGANPFIDPDGYESYLDRQEKNFLSRLEEQRNAPPR